MMKVIKVNNSAIDLTQVIAVSDIKIQEFKFNNSKTYYFEVYFNSGSMLTLTDKSSSMANLMLDHTKLIDEFEKLNNTQEF